jgi:hypothetical protein
VRLVGFLQTNFQKQNKSYQTEIVSGENQENPYQTVQGFRDRTKNSENPVLHENHNHFLSRKVSWSN